tara:strand:+ start:754 stop:891 length:138 start_codon:yes stop_codon:yes gene_type:complete
MTWKTLQLSDYNDVMDMLYLLQKKCDDTDLEYDIGVIIDKLEESK